MQFDINISSNYLLEQYFRLTQLVPLDFFCISWKQKARGFLLFSVGIGRGYGINRVIAFWLVGIFVAEFSKAFLVTPLFLRYQVKMK